MYLLPLMIRAAEIGYSTAYLGLSRAPAQSLEFSDLLKDARVKGDSNRDDKSLKNSVKLMEAFAQGYQCQCDEDAWDIIPTTEEKPSLAKLIINIEKQNKAR